MINFETIKHCRGPEGNFIPNQFCTITNISTPNKCALITAGLLMVGSGAYYLIKANSNFGEEGKVSKSDTVTGYSSTTNQFFYS